MKKYTENDLKCCGNCIHRINMDMGNYIAENCHKKKILNSYGLCKKWECDNLTQGSREL